MEPEVVISFKFVGGDADEHQLNFYDTSRFMYGASRFLYTLEHFRQTGKVLGKINERVNVDYRVATPQQSSWLLDVLAIAGPAIHEAAIKVPVGVLVAYVKDKLFSGKDAAAKALDIIREVEGNKTKQSKEETKRFLAQSDVASQALKLVDKTLDMKKSTDDALIQELRELRHQLSAAERRKDVLELYADELAAITAEQEEKLLTKTQPQVAEMGKPLIRSAGRLEIAVGDGRIPMSSMTRRSVESLTGHEEDPLPTQLAGDITRFDKGNGWGKFRSPIFKRDISFVVPAARKNRLRGTVLDAMKMDNVIVSFYMVRDKRKVVKYLVFEDIIEIDVD
ncbi:hypothetical protein [Magnetospirillum sp. 64-120]|uniref:DUF7946 domain-containing protein n=1 Tax=Magnetospirillum sp. 64-120 TaxID=1895778 RepID=UPI0025C62CCC|nr:hypothetical protein [Magnetospirillum sp. 64-120]